MGSVRWCSVGFAGMLILAEAGCGGGATTSNVETTPSEEIEWLEDIAQEEIGVAPEPSPDVPFAENEPETEVLEEVTELPEAVEITNDIATDPEPEPEEYMAPDPGVETVQLPKGCIVGEFTVYYGNMHAHTDISDGKADPATAFAHARDVAKIDIQYITDHLEQLYVIPCLFPNDGWKACNEMADAATVPGKFIAGCGFEYGTSLAGLTGHNNVFFSKELFPCLQLYFEQFYQTLAACAECIGQFNHPGDSGLQTWANFKYDAAVDEKMNLFEFNSDPAWDLFFEALDKGWHVSPVYNQDNHGADWGSKNENRAGFYMTELTREALHVAMKERRSFATTDKDASIALKSEDGCWMGSILEGVASLTVIAEVADAEPEDGFSSIEFWGPKATKLGAVDCGGEGSCSGSFVLDATKVKYVFARALQSDGDFLVSAPIWASP